VQRLSESALRVLDHGAHLTAQLLASSGAQRLQLGAVPIGPLLHGMRSRIERHLPPRVRLQMHVTGDAGTVMADATQLESAILNLVLNACDAMQGLRRGGVVTVSCEGALLSGDHELPTGEYLRVSVSDVGTGMSEAVRERAFEPFFTTRPLAEGGHARGLGLSQVHGFSRQCGGSARIMSTGPGGTTVCMLLPLLGPAEVGSAHERIEAPEEPVALVLADSNSPLRQLLCDSLRLLGHRAVPVADAPAMVAALQRHRTADVVLIDVTQPRRDGHSGSELAQRLRLAWPELGVVLVGSEAAAVSPERHQPVLQAPFDLAALSQVMDQAIESAGPAEHEP
jgi:CheY-like chemotaxis protein